MNKKRFRAEDLVAFGIEILTHPKIGFTEKQANATARVLAEADLRGDPDHGIIGVCGVGDICRKVMTDTPSPDINRINTPGILKKEGKEEDYVLADEKYPTVIGVDANGLPGHYVALETISDVVQKAKQLGCAKAYIKNSTHFGNCGIYSEWIAENDLAARVTTTSPAWTKPFVETQKDDEKSRQRYSGVRKRFGTNPIAWSIPYDRGIITIDMAATQRAVSPPVDAAKFNASVLGIAESEDGRLLIGKGDRKTPLRDVHLRLARIDNEDDLKKEIADYGYGPDVRLTSVEKGLLKGPEGEDIQFPLAFDDVFKEKFWIAPLGGTYFGYKGFGLNMLIELDNVVGGGEAGLIRQLDTEGRRETPERVSHTIEAYAIDALYPLKEAKARLGEAVRVTAECGNDLMFLPGEKEQLCRKRYMEQGAPLSAKRLTVLRSLAEELGIPFRLTPLKLP